MDHRGDSTARVWLGGVLPCRPRGEANLERLDEVDAGNARGLAENPERDPRVPADRLDRGGEALVAYARQVDGDPA